MAERIDGESRYRRIIQIVVQPLMALDQLINHGIHVHIRLVRHATQKYRDELLKLEPSNSGNSKSLIPKGQKSYTQPPVTISKRPESIKLLSARCLVGCA